MFSSASAVYVIPLSVVWEMFDGCSFCISSCVCIITCSSSSSSSTNATTTAFAVTFIVVLSLLFIEGSTNLIPDNISCDTYSLLFLNSPYLGNLCILHSA